MRGSDVQERGAHGAGRRAQGVGHRAQVSGRVSYWVSRSTVIVDSPDRSRSNAQSLGFRGFGF